MPWHLPIFTKVRAQSGSISLGQLGRVLLVKVAVSVAMPSSPLLFLVTQRESYPRCTQKVKAVRFPTHAHVTCSLHLSAPRSITPAIDAERERERAKPTNAVINVDSAVFVIFLFAFC